MYLQYDPGNGRDTPEGAALHYIDEEQGREHLRWDRVWYTSPRRLPFAQVTVADHNRSRSMQLFRSEPEAREALGLLPREASR